MVFNDFWQLFDMKKKNGFNHTDAWEFSTQISQYVKLQQVYYTTTFTCSYKCTANEQYKY